MKRFINLNKLPAFWISLREDLVIAAVTAAIALFLILLISFFINFNEIKWGTKVLLFIYFLLCYITLPFFFLIYVVNKLVEHSRFMAAFFNDSKFILLLRPFKSKLIKEDIKLERTLEATYPEDNITRESNSYSYDVIIDLDQQMVKHKLVVLGKHDEHLDHIIIFKPKNTTWFKLFKKLAKVSNAILILPGSTSGITQ